MGLGNTPRRQTVISLDARKSFALGLRFLRNDTGGKLDLTGATVRFVLAQPDRLGGAVLATKTATLVSAVDGVAQVELQASDLDLEPEEYPYSVTLVSANGYSTPVLAGVVALSDNPDTDTTNVYAGINPSTSLAAYVESGDVVQVNVDKVDGMYVIVSTMIAQTQAELDAQVAAAASSATSAQTSATNAQTSAGQASTSAGQASTSATNAASSASTASTKATEAASSASGAASSAASAQTSATAANQSAVAAKNSETGAAGSASTASTKASQAATSATNAAASATAADSSEAAAATSAGQAASSASSASTSAGQAASSATDAAASATSATTSKDAAAASATSATTSKDAAAASASAAATSETNAATSASNAATSANQAATSATSAASSATAADTSEANAAQSASDAAASAAQAEAIVTGDLDPVIAGKVTDPASQTYTAVTTRITNTAPAAHNHDDRYFTETEVNTALAGKSNTGHTHAQADVTGLGAALAGKSDTGHTHTKANITDFAHSHAIADLPVAASGVSDATKLTRSDDARLSDARTPVAHSHAQADVTGLAGALAGKSDTGHTHTKAAITDFAHTHPAADLGGAGTRDATTFLRGDNIWAAPPNPDISGKLDKTGGTITGDLAVQGKTTLGDANQDIIEQMAARVETHTRSTTNTYTSGKLTQVLEKDGATTVRTTTLTYTGENLTQVVEVCGGKTVTTTLTYTGSDLTGTSRTVA